MRKGIAQSRGHRRMLLAALGMGALASAAFGRGQKESPVGVDTRMAPPPAAKDVQVLFGGKPEHIRGNWNGGNWKFADGAMEVRGGSIASKAKFKDFMMHLEFRAPNMPNAKGQAKGNSGVYLQGLYEIQVLDSYGIAEPGKGDCGALYNQAAPLVNACRPPMQWQTYDIIFRTPRYDADRKMVERGYVTVLQNGLVIQNNQIIQGPTAYPENKSEDYSQPGPIALQDHGNPVQYRNIWVMPLPEKGSGKY